MFSDKTERNSTRRSKLAKAISAYKHTDSIKLVVEYLHLTLDTKLNVLLTASGEEAIAVRGELRNIKSLLTMLEQSDAPFTDSIN